MNMEGCEKEVGPSSWVQTLLEVFGDRRKEEMIHSPTCNQGDNFSPIFCIDCLKLDCKFCHKGANYPHKQHLVLRSYKASHQDGLRADEVSKLIDISDIHPYVINHKRLVFINRKLFEKSKCRNKKAAYKCKTCGREFQRDKSFCSIECKSESGRNLLQAPQVQSYRKRKRKGTPRRAPFF